jgi:hypothetical protein
VAAASATAPHSAESGSAEATAVALAPSFEGGSPGPVPEIVEDEPDAPLGAVPWIVLGGGLATSGAVILGVQVARRRERLRARSS